MNPEDTMIEIVVSVRRDGVVASQFSYDQDVSRNTHDLVIIGALEIVTQSMRMDRIHRITKGEK